MTDLFLGVIALIWLGGYGLRIYRQARFFQIEEYMNLRYLRWWLRRPEHLLPRRPLVAVGLAALLALLFSETQSALLPGLILSLAALVAVWPPDEGEIKKRFKRTPRATRLLGASFFVALLDIAVALLLVDLLDIEDPAPRLVLLMAGGLLAFMTAPITLVIGNLLMYPVEAFMRGRFIASARAVMNEIQPTVIGITGSYGKTTTKTFLAEILNGRWRAYPTPKSFNTMMGVSLAINRDLTHDYSIDYFIVEMGAYIRGEIQRICELTPPHISIVVEVGPQHLERFGSLENVALAKYEIIKNLPPDGVGIFNWDNAYVREMYERGYPQTRIAVSRTLSPDEVPAGGPRFVATDISESLEGIRFTLHDTETGEKEDFAMPVLGEHNVTNVMLAAAVAVHEGMPLRDVAFRARQLKPAESRLVRQTTAQGITIINDAYSANPAGVVGALKVLAMHDSGKRLLITPGMVELGPLHEQENKRLGEIASQYATDVILVGREQTAPVRAGLLAAGFPQERLHVVDELREAVDWYQQHLASGDAVLFLNDLPDTY